MANSVNYVSYSHSLGNSQDLESRFTVTFSGSYVNGTGETVNLKAAGNPNGLELNGALPAATLPEGYADVLFAQFGEYEPRFTEYSAGAFNLRFYQKGTDTELASGAYPSDITSGQLNVGVRTRV